jgi:hypothetical protein
VNGNEFDRQAQPGLRDSNRYLHTVEAKHGQPPFSLQGRRAKGSKRD